MVPGLSYLPGLSQGAAITDRVTIASSAQSADFQSFTALYVCRPTTIASRVMVFKGTAAADSIRNLQISGAAGNVTVSMRKTTVDGIYVTNWTPMVTANRIYCVAATFDAAASPAGHIYVGVGVGPDIIVPLTEGTYGTATDGTGTVPADAGTNLFLGNNFANDATMAGTNWCGGYMPGIVPFAELLKFQQNIYYGGVLAQQRAGGFWLHNLNGSAGNVIDISGYGNHGVITGSVASADALPVPFVRNVVHPSWCRWRVA